MISKSCPRTSRRRGTAAPPGSPSLWPASWAGLLCLLLSLSALSGCHPKRGQRAAEDKQATADPGAPAAGTEDLDKAVARVGSATITVGRLTDEINQQNPYVRMRYNSLEQKKKFLEHMIQFELLVQEARKRKLDKDPEVVRRVEREMVNRMMARMREELVKLEDITDADVKAYYQQHINLYVQPEMVRVSMVVCETEGMARTVLARAQAKPGDTRAFAELVNLYSVDPVSKVRRGDLDFFGRDSDKVPGPVVQAAFGVKEMWGLAGPVKFEGGYAVLMKTGHREAASRTLEQEAEQIRNGLFNERRLEAIEKFVAGLKAKARIEIDDKLLAKVKPRMKPVPPAAPGHGHPVEP